MSFTDKLRCIVGGWSDSAPDTFVEEQSERLVELVFTKARQAVETAHVPRPNEAAIIGALLDKLHDAGY